LEISSWHGADARRRTSGVSRALGHGMDQHGGALRACHLGALAWLPPSWAIAGGLLTALQLTGSYWDSYWGGTLAAIGGALLVGAMARLMRRPARASAITFGLGLAILANTRPYEGFVLGGLCTLFLFARLISLVRRGREDASHLIRVIGVPLLSVLLLTILWMGYYNYRITGDPLLMPYMAYDHQYSLA